MNINLTLKNTTAFLALTFVMHEAHEIVHTAVGRLICGCWGERDFNLWGLCEGCIEAHPTSLIATFVGPLFTFIMIWIGLYLMRKNENESNLAIGFALIFSNMPFARIFTAAIGGDEVYGLSQMMENYEMAWAIGLISIIFITFYPLLIAYSVIEKNRIGWFLLFFIVPMIIDLLVVLGGLNALLAAGVGSKTWILGSPIIVTIWTFFVFLTLGFTARFLPSLNNAEMETKL